MSFFTNYHQYHYYIMIEGTAATWMEPPHFSEFSLDYFSPYSRTSFLQGRNTKIGYVYPSIHRQLPLWPHSNFQFSLRFFTFVKKKILVKCSSVLPFFQFRPDAYFSEEGGRKKEITSHYVYYTVIYVQSSAIEKGKFFPFSFSEKKENRNFFSLPKIHRTSFHAYPWNVLWFIC